VWFALARAPIEVAHPSRDPTMPFTVRLEIRPPRGVRPVVGALVKGVFDGAVAAFQAHTDRSSVAELAARVAHHLSAAPEEVEALLLNQDKAVLGLARRLLHVRGAGVQWAPADDLCVAGELLTGEGRSASWSLRGVIAEVEPASATQHRLTA
jgi:hypothetical protein